MNYKMVRGYGFPDRTFFELYNGQCNGRSADKLYSVQVADWEKFLSKRIIDSGHEIWETPNVEYKYTPTAAVVDIDVSDQSIKVGEHIRVVPTVALASFLESKGFGCPSEVWVNPDAFGWKEYGEYESETGDQFFPGKEDEPYNGGTENQSDKKNVNGKVVLAALVAAISLLK